MQFNAIRHYDTSFGRTDTDVIKFVIHIVNIRYHKLCVLCTYRKPTIRLPYNYRPLPNNRVAWNVPAGLLRLWSAFSTFRLDESRNWLLPTDWQSADILLILLSPNKVPKYTLSDKFAFMGNRNNIILPQAMHSMHAWYLPITQNSSLR